VIGGSSGFLLLGQTGVALQSFDGVTFSAVDFTSLFDLPGGFGPAMINYKGMYVIIVRGHVFSSPVAASLWGRKSISGLSSVNLGFRGAVAGTKSLYTVVSTGNPTEIVQTHYDSATSRLIPRGKVKSQFIKV
jgi:hypothetical protein